MDLGDNCSGEGEVILAGANNYYCPDSGDFDARDGGGGGDDVDHDGHEEEY